MPDCALLLTLCLLVWYDSVYTRHGGGRRREGGQRREGGGCVQVSLRVLVTQVQHTQLAVGALKLRRIALLIRRVHPHRC